MKVDLNRHLAYPTIPMSPPLSYDGWNRILDGHNCYWTTYTRKDREIVAARLNAFWEGGHVADLVARTTHHLRTVFALPVPNVLHVSVNGSYPSRLGSYHPHDIDGSVVVNEPGLQMECLLESPLTLPDGFQVQSFGVVSADQFRDITAGPKIFAEAASHLSGGYPLAGGYFPVSNMTVGHLLMQARWLLVVGLARLETRCDFHKALLRLIEARSIMNMLEIEAYPRYQDAWNRMGFYENADDSIRETQRLILSEEIRAFIGRLDGIFGESGIMGHDNLPFQPNQFAFKDWDLCWKIIRKVDPGRDEIAWVLGHKDYGITFMLAAQARQPFVLKMIREDMDEHHPPYAPAVMKILALKEEDIR